MRHNESPGEEEVRKREHAYDLGYLLLLVLWPYALLRSVIRKLLGKPE